MGNTVPAAPRAASPERGSSRPSDLREFHDASKAIFTHGPIAAVRLFLENQSAQIEAMGAALEHALRSTSAHLYQERATIASALSILADRRRVPQDAPERSSHVEAALEETSAKLSAILEAGLDGRLSRVEAQLVDVALCHNDRLTKLEQAAERATPGRKPAPAQLEKAARAPLVTPAILKELSEKAGAAAPEIVAPMAPPLSESAAALEKARAQVSDRRTLSVGADA